MAISRGALGVLAFVALAVLVLVPPGYMVSGKPDGPARIVICTGHGPVEAAVDLGKAPPARGGKADKPCAFAAHAGSAAQILKSATLGVAWSAPAGHHPILASQVSVGLGLAAPPPARAPPTLL
jgi:hypothetical protein